MNEPMTAKRRAKLVRMVEREMWDELSEEWAAARPPFGYLKIVSNKDGGGSCGCPSQVRFCDSRSDLLSGDHDALSGDKLIPNMEDLTSHSFRARIRDELQANPREIFDRFEHYQRLVTS